MKKNVFLTLSLILLSSMTLSGCGPKAPINGGSSDTSSVVAIKKLQIKENATKTSFEVGDHFSSEGLKIEVVETLNNEVISRSETTDYTLSYNEGEPLNNDTILQEGTYEVMIVSTNENIRSTSYEISVKMTTKKASLYSVVKKMVDTNNYTVNNTVGSDNEVTGLMTKDALLWDATERAYFMDEDFGYGTHDGKTFRYKLIDNEIKNAIYLVDLGGKVEDHGLFDIDTVDNMAERRISNYNIKGITSDDLTYLEGLEPTSDNPNRYQIDASHSKWLFNAIGHTQLTINPVYFLTSGATNGKIYLEVKDYGLDVTLITAEGIDGVKGCVAKISNIGTTEIPGMKEFLKNPVFTKAASSLDKFQKVVNNNNYQFLYAEENRDVSFTSDYVYGQEFKNNTINLNENNSLAKPNGAYRVSIDKDNNVTVGEKVSETSYLKDFNLFAHLNDYFIKDEINPNSYIYKVNSIKEQTSELMNYLQTFTKFKMEAVSAIKLDLMFAGDAIFQATITVMVGDEEFDSVICSNINTTSNAILDGYIATLY